MCERQFNFTSSLICAVDAKSIVLHIHAALITLSSRLRFAAVASSRDERRDAILSDKTPANANAFIASALPGVETTAAGVPAILLVNHG